MLGIGPVENYKSERPRRNPSDRDAQIQVSGAQVGSDWLDEVHRWWLQHSRYPEAAIQRNEQGQVTIRFKVDRSGHTTGGQILSASGSQWLDLQTMATWNNAHLPPLPFNTPENEATVTVTIDYILLH
jgi:protein TonB